MVAWSIPRLACTPGVLAYTHLHKNPQKSQGAKLIIHWGPNSEFQRNTPPIFWHVTLVGNILPKCGAFHNHSLSTNEKYYCLWFTWETCLALGNRRTKSASIKVISWLAWGLKSDTEITWDFARAHASGISGQASFNFGESEALHPLTRALSAASLCALNYPVLWPWK